MDLSETSFEAQEQLAQQLTVVEQVNDAGSKSKTFVLFSMAGNRQVGSERPKTHSESSIASPKQATLPLLHAARRESAMVNAVSVYACSRCLLSCFPWCQNFSTKTVLLNKKWDVRVPACGHVHIYVYVAAFICICA